MKSNVIIFNPSYGLKHDIKRTYLYTRMAFRDTPNVCNASCFSLYPKIM